MHAATAALCLLTIVPVARLAEPGVISQSTAPLPPEPGIAIDPASAPPSARANLTNAAEIADPFALLLQLRGVYFDWDAAHGGARDIGMIAEEVAAAVPEAVAFDAAGAAPERVDLARLVPLLVEATKELLARAETTERTVRRLEARAAAQSSESSRIDAFARQRDADFDDFGDALTDQSAEIRRLGEALREQDRVLRAQQAELTRTTAELSRLSAVLAALDPGEIEDRLDEIEDDHDDLRRFVLKHIRDDHDGDPG